MKELRVLIGLSASGKSTYVKNIADERSHVIVVSSDDIRAELSNRADQSRNAEVFQIFHKRIDEALKNNDDVCVVCDATNITLKSRRPIIQIGKKHNAEIVGDLILKPVGNCVSDDKTREFSVGKAVIDKQVKKFEVPFFAEGFDKINIHTLTGLMRIDNNIFEQCMEDIKTFNQNNPHHELSLGDHCEKVAELFRIFSKDSEFSRLEHGVLFHDLGKAFTETLDENNVSHYYHHENVGAYTYLTFCAYMETPMFEARDMLSNAFVINYHMRPFGWTTEKAVNKAKKLFGDGYYILDVVHVCDVVGCKKYE
jgi:predicted kinase